MNVERLKSGAAAGCSGRSHPQPCAWHVAAPRRACVLVSAALSHPPARSTAAARRELVQQVRAQSQRLREHLSQLQASSAMREAAPVAEVLEQLRSLDAALSSLEHTSAGSLSSGSLSSGSLSSASLSSCDSDSSGDEWEIDATAMRSTSNSSSSSGGSIRSSGSSSDSGDALSAGIAIDADVLAAAVAMFGPVDSPLRSRGSSGSSTSRGSSERDQQQLLLHTPGGGSMTLPVPSLDPPAAAPPALPAVPPNARGLVVVCQGKKCQRRGGDELMQQAEALTQHAPGVKVTGCKCLGRCKEAPAMRVKASGSDGTTYARVQPSTLPRLLDRHFADGSE